MHYVPLSIRRLAFINSCVLPFQISRLGLYFALSPIGKEKKWIHNIKQDSWEGNWIAPNQKSIKEVEMTAVNKDVIILYIHDGGKKRKSCFLCCQVIRSYDWRITCELHTT